MRQRYTGKERDDETNLDYFLTRYYSSTQGRFTSPDEFKGGPDELFVLGTGDEEKQALPYADVTNPQTLNKYQYCLNNPLRFIDPDGHQDTEKKGITEQISEYIGSLIKQLLKQKDPMSVAEEREERGPDPYRLADKDTIVERDALMRGDGVDIGLQAAELIDFTGGVSSLRAYAKGDKTGAAINAGIGVAGALTGGGGGRGAATITLREAKSLLGRWSTTTSLGKVKHLVQHAYAGHGASVGAKNLWQYLRKAASFNMKGAHREVFENGNRIRYLRKDGTYLITDAKGNFVSYGRN